MKIVIIHNLYEPYSRGGAEQVVKTTIDFLRSEGHDVSLITLSSEQEELVEKENLKIYRLKQKNIFSYFDLGKHNFFAKLLWHLIDIFNFDIAKKVKEILQEEKPRVVHTHNLMGLSFQIPKVIRKLQIKHIHTVHDVQLVEPSGIIIKAKENSYRYKCPPIKLYGILMAKLIGSPDVVISPTEFLLDFYKNKGFFKNSKLEKLSNPFTLKLSENFVKQNHEGFNFLYLGQIEEHKGILKLLENFEKIKGANLHVVGGGSLLKKLREKYSDLENIKFYGLKSREELPEIFSKMDLTIFPSLCYENYPAVIIESLLFSVPVLSARHSALTELIDENKNGCFFDVNSENDLKEKLNWCLENKKDIKNMSEKTLENFFAINNIDYFQRLLGFYKD